MGLSIGASLEDATLRQSTLIMVGGYAAQALVACAFVYLAMQARAGRSPRPLSQVKAAAVGAGALLLFWPMLSLVAFVATALVLMIRGEAPNPIAHETLAMLVRSEPDVWLFTMVALVLIAAPVLEEVLYRGVLQETLRRMGLGPWTAIGASSALFAFMHITAAPEPAALPGLLAALFVLSLGFGWAYEKTGRLMAPITMHVLFNAGNLALAMTAST
jgi:membrane protease YdiL (CAAX protease family)